ncbi:hypothetical protein [uncultured Streptococcus sp.]|nr:hypothetical protein [uncultured Streptococcus sp.]
MITSEKFAFQTKAGLYQNKDDDNCFSLLVERCEAMIKYRD